MSAWEEVRHLTMDQFVTFTKLRGSGLVLSGHTTPEGWPFAIFVGVGKNGNGLPAELALQAGQELERAGTPKTGGTNPDSVASGILWLQQTVHQAHHLDEELETCRVGTCIFARALARKAGAIR